MDKPTIVSDPPVPLFTSRDAGSPGAFTTFRKTRLTSARRIDGPFEVETPEGTLRCEDGWLALDAHGFPYPIAADEFELIYEVAP